MPRYNDDFKKMVVEMLNDGAKKNDIKNKFNVSISTLNLWLREIGKKETPQVAEKEYAEIIKENVKLKKENNAVKKIIEMLIAEGEIY